jgi:hypothetical protein
MGWKTVKSNIKFVINNKPIAAGILLGIGFVAGYYVKLLAVLYVPWYQKRLASLGERHGSSSKDTPF